MMIPIKIGKKDPIYCWVFGSDYDKAIKTKGSLEYFIKGQGRKRTKAFEKIEGLPDRWTKLSALEIAKIADQYSSNLAKEYAEQHTCGLMAGQWTRGYHEMYKRTKHILKDEDVELFGMLRCDYMLGIIGVYELDIVGLDEHFGKIDPEYFPEAALYKDKPCSMTNYVLQKYGQHAVDVINACTTMPDVVKQCEVYRPGKGFVEETIDSRHVAKFVRENYLQSNVLELTLENFEAWADELPLESIVKKVVSEIESNNLKLEI